MRVRSVWLVVCTCDLCVFEYICVCVCLQTVFCACVKSVLVSVKFVCVRVSSVFCCVLSKCVCVCACKVRECV